MFIKKYLYKIVILTFFTLPLFSQVEDVSFKDRLNIGDYGISYYFMPGNSKQYWPCFLINDTLGNIPIYVPIHGIAIRYYVYFDTLDKKVRFYAGSGGLKIFYGSGSKHIDDLYGYDTFSKSSILGATVALGSFGSKLKLNENFVVDVGVDIIRLGICYNTLTVDIQKGTQEINLYDCQEKFAPSFALYNLFTSFGFNIKHRYTINLKAGYDLLRGHSFTGTYKDPVHSSDNYFDGLSFGLEEVFADYRLNPVYYCSGAAVIITSLLSTFSLVYK